MDKIDALLQALNEERVNMGCSGVEPYVTLSDLLDRIIDRVDELTRD